MTKNRHVFITMIGLLVMIFSFVGCKNQQTERNENVMTDNAIDSQKNIRCKLQLAPIGNEVCIASLIKRFWS